MKTGSLLPVLLMLAALLTAPATGSGQTTVAGLNYQTGSVLINGVPADAACSIMQAQHWYRTGEDVPLSQMFLRLVAAEYPDVYVVHGFSSPHLAWQLCHDHGACPATMKPWTAAARTAALTFRVGGLLTLADVPDYAAALVHLQAHPGDGILLATDGYQSYAIVGVDEDLRGVWVDHYRSGGRAAVLLLDETDGSVLWDAMLYGQSLGPENYMVVIQPRQD